MRLRFPYVSVTREAKIPLAQVLPYAQDLHQAYVAERARAAELRTALDDLRTAYMSAIESLVAALDARDSETEDHSKRVMIYVSQVCENMGIETSLIEGILRGVLLHDVGKIGISDAILRKPGPLTDKEWEQMRKHPTIGYNILKGKQFLETAAIVVLQHHERYDGRGYPNGIAGNDIHVGARIFAVADAFDAMVSDRPYRKAMGVDKAIGELTKGAGTQFDSAVVDSFLRVLAQLGGGDPLDDFEGRFNHPQVSRGLSSIRLAD